MGKSEHNRSAQVNTNRLLSILFVISASMVLLAAIGSPAAGSTELWECELSLCSGDDCRLEALELSDLDLSGMKLGSSDSLQISCTALKIHGSMRNYVDELEQRQRALAAKN